MRRRCVLIAGLLTLLALPVVCQPTQPSTSQAYVLPVSDVTKAYQKSNVTLQGTITSYTPPRTEKAPHSFMLKDNSGSIRIAAWKDVWEAIPVRDKLQPGAEVTVRAEIAEFQGKLEGHLNSGQDIQLGLAKPAATAPSPAAGASPPTPVASAPDIAWQPDIATALRAASSSGKKVMVFFSAPDAENSSFVETRILGDARVRAALARSFAAVRVDMKQQPDLARQLGVFRAGTVGLYKPDGSAACPHVAPRSAEDLLKALE